jgi:hypothetical protein
MAKRAAALVDEVLRQVPVGQWVLTLPYRLRYRLTWDHALCRAVLGHLPVRGLARNRVTDPSNVRVHGPSPPRKYTIKWRGALLAS